MESSRSQAVHERRVLLHGPDGHGTAPAQRPLDRVEPPRRIQPRIIPLCRRVRSVVHIQQDRVVLAFSRENHPSNVIDDEFRPGVVQRVSSERPKVLAIPVHHRFHQFRDHYLCVLRHEIQRRPRRVSHAESANQHPHGRRRTLAGQPHHRVFGPVRAADHQVVAVCSDYIIAIVPSQLKAAAVRHRRVRQGLSGLHQAHRSYRPSCALAACPRIVRSTNAGGNGMTGLSGRTALVTGGSRGIGRAIALRLAEDGADVAVNYRGNQQDAENVVASIRAMGRRAEAYQADVSDPVACDAMVGRLVADFPAIDILVNNAGIGSSGIGRPTITEATPEQVNLLVGANLLGPIHLCRNLVPHMRKADRSDIIMISSVATQTMSARMGVYSITKAGLEALAHTLAKEEREHGMRVNIVAPGLVETDMGRNLIRQLPGPDDMRERDAMSPFGFVCQPEDIANAVAFLVSDQGRYITNQRLTVNGGGF